MTSSHEVAGSSGPSGRVNERGLEQRRVHPALGAYAGEIIACLPGGLAVVDADLRMLAANEAFQVMLGIPVAVGVEGRQLDGIVPLGVTRELANSILDGRENSAGTDCTFGQRWLRVGMTAITFGKREMEGQRLLVTVEDITREKAYAARVEQLAFYDSLTGLPNRTLFVERLLSTLVDVEQRGESLVVLYIDLDRFKAINDTRGHIVGNQVLQEVADRFRGAVRASELVARLGGDEFAIIARNRDRAAALQMADQLMGVVAEPLTSVERRASVGASIGIALYPDDGQTAEDLVGRADIAMYWAKAAGGGYRFYDPAMGVGMEVRVPRSEAFG